MNVCYFLCKERTIRNEVFLWAIPVYAPQAFRELQQCAFKKIIHENMREKQL